MDIEHTLDKLRDVVTAKRVYGEAYERNGVTIIPAARVRGGGGVGGGEGVSGGGGAGFGMKASPAGALIVKGDQVSWMPALDLSRIVERALLVAMVGLLALRSLGWKTRGRRRR